MMVNRSLIEIMKQIGLSDRHGVVYDNLLGVPSSTPLQLARETKLNRSSLYRYLEELRAKGLVELVMGDKTNRYRANPDGLTQYLVAEESRVESLKETIPALVAQLQDKAPAKESQVKYYHGIEGLKQMLWNVVASKEDIVGLGYEDWNASVGKSYAEKLRAKLQETKVKSREILNEIDDSYEYTSQGKEYTKVYDHRQIDRSVLEIKHDTYIYGDVFAYYYHYQGEYFGVEIHNAQIARAERQVFEILWGMAK